MTISLEEVTLGKTEKSGTLEATLKISSGATWGRRAEWCRNQRGHSWWGGDILISSHCCCDIFGRCVSSSAIFINWFFPLPKKAIPDHLWHTHTHTQVLASNGRGGGMYVNPLERVSSLHNSQPSTISVLYFSLQDDLSVCSCTCYSARRTRTGARPKKSQVGAC